MEHKLRTYLWWKAKQSERKQVASGLQDSVRRPSDNFPQLQGSTDDLSEALKRKDKEKEERRASRRRVRGGVPGTRNRNEGKAENKGQMFGVQMREEADSIAAL
jgi:DNA excision repair protein ERCC-4